MKKFFAFFISLALSAAAHAASSDKENFLATGQGVSYPTLTSNVWFSNGLTHENAVGAMYQNGMKFTAEYVDLDPSGSIIGAELGFGKGDLGAAIGAAKSDCDGCETQIGATAGMGFSSVAFGIGYHEDVISLGFIMNPKDTHRVGIVADSSSESSNKYTSFGAGYTYVGSEFNFTIDASKRDTDGATAAANEIIYLTPGVMFKGDSFQLSLNYDTDTNDEGDVHESDFWFGVGFSPANPTMAASIIS